MQAHFEVGERAFAGLATVEETLQFHVHRIGLFFRHHDAFAIEPHLGKLQLALDERVRALHFVAIQQDGQTFAAFAGAHQRRADGGRWSVLARRGGRRR